MRSKDWVVATRELLHKFLDYAEQIYMPVPKLLVAVDMHASCP